MTRAVDMLIGRGRKRAALPLAFGAALLALALAPQAATAQFFWEQPRFSPDDAARVAMQHGFRVLARPLRNDDVYVVQVIDRRGAREQLIIASDTGEILQRAYLGVPRRYRAPMDPSIPPGPIPPERIPDDRDHGGFFARLFGGDDSDGRPPEADLGPINRPGLEPLPMPRPQHGPRRRPQVVEQSPETIHQAPVESAPLAPPSAAPSLPPRLAPPRPAMTPRRAPEASLPPPAAAPEPAPKAAPTPTPAPDRPTRSISRDPLAIPGSREQDEKASKAVKAEPAPAKAPEPAAPVKPPVPKNPVAVAPLE